MDKLKSLLNLGKPAPSPSAGASAGDDATKDEGEALLDPEVQGVDPRRLADLKAEEAGRRWRRKAEAEGNVPKETGGPKGLEPTRYGDWEKAGRCYDF